MKDFYEILGIDRNATEDEIKKSYRNLARQWHPDKFSTKSEEERKNAEEKFKEISEAYDTLSDPEKRQAYDMGGFNPFEGMGGFNPFEEMSDFFHGFGRHNRRQMRRKGEDIHVNVDVTLKEIYDGSEKNIEYDVYTECPKCKGKRSLNPNGVKECPHCNGTGVITQYIQKGHMTEIHQSPCPHCHATGTILTDPCPECNGSGVTMKKATVKINVPKTAIINAVISIPNIGHACPTTTDNNVICENGDLVITFRLVNDGYFKLVSPFNLLHVEKIKLSDALLGTTIKVKDIDDKEIKIKLDELTPPEKVYTFEKKGMMDEFGNRGMYGVKIEYEMPSKLTPELKKALKNLK